MKIQQEDTYTIITPEIKSNFKEFFTDLSNILIKHEGDNIILNFLDFTIELDEIASFKDISENKIENGTSFVLVKLDVDLDKIPDEVIIAPTLHEAIDIIDMDEMMRILDF